MLRAGFVSSLRLSSTPLLTPSALPSAPQAARVASASLRSPFVVRSCRCTAAFSNDGAAGWRQYHTTAVTAEKSDGKKPSKQSSYKQQMISRSAAGTPPASSPGATEEDDEDPPMPKGIVPKVKYLWKQYGTVALALYGGSYVGMFFGASAIYMANNNWGLDPFELIAKVGLEDTAARYLGVTRETQLSQRNLSFLLAWVTTEALEPVRLGITLLGAKKVRKMLNARKRRKAGRGSGGHGP